MNVFHVGLHKAWKNIGPLIKALILYPLFALLSLQATAAEQSEHTLENAMSNARSKATAELVRPIENLFAAMPVSSGESLSEWVTPDFQLLEVGEVWDIDQLTDAVRGDYQRDNYFVLLRAEIDQNMAWVSYWNRAVITFEGEQSELVWLESAVLNKAGDRWLIHMLHSTRLAPDAVPAGLDWQQSSLR